MGAAAASGVRGEYTRSTPPSVRLHSHSGDKGGPLSSPRRAPPLFIATARAIGPLTKVDSDLVHPKIPQDSQIFPFQTSTRSRLEARAPPGPSCFLFLFPPPLPPPSDRPTPTLREIKNAPPCGSFVDSPRPITSLSALSHSVSLCWVVSCVVRVRQAVPRRLALVRCMRSS